MKNLTKKIIGSLFILFMINSTQAQNELDIIGNWILDSASFFVHVPGDDLDIEQEDIDMIEFYISTGIYTEDDFFEEFGFPLPTSQEEWDEILTNGINMEITDSQGEFDISAFTITESLFGVLFEGEGLMPIQYSWSNDTIISLETSSNEFPLSEITVLHSTNESLVMSSSETVLEEDGEYNYTIIFYCSSAEEFTWMYRHISFKL